MKTENRLAKALREAGLIALSRQAERGEFDMLQHGVEAIQPLVRALRAHAYTSKPARQLLRRVMQGEFINTKAEVSHHHERVAQARGSTTE